MLHRICLSRIEMEPRICLSLVERFLQELEKKSTTYKTLSPDVFPTETHNPEFNKKNCNKGYSCGDTCISKTRKCRKKAGEDKKPVLESLSEVTASSKNKTTAPEAAKSKDKKVTAKKEKKSPGAEKSDTRTEKTTKFQPPINETELARRREMLVQVVGEKMVAAFEKTAQRIVDNSELMIRVRDVEILEKIISDRFKSQFETGTSMGMLAPEHRAHTEKLMFGYEDNLPPSQRPIYGYLSTDKSDRSNRNEYVANYGDISIRLKPEVRSRATLTGTDSLIGGWMTDFYPPSRLDKVNAGSFFRKVEIKSDTFVKTYMSLAADAKNFDEFILRKGHADYIEVQIHGQVKPSDIKEIVFLRGERPTPKILKWAKENNVNIVVI